jgi:hypothetical protein
MGQAEVSALGPAFGGYDVPLTPKATAVVRDADGVIVGGLNHNGMDQELQPGDSGQAKFPSRDIQLPRLTSGTIESYADPVLGWIVTTDPVWEDLCRRLVGQTMYWSCSARNAVYSSSLSWRPEVAISARPRKYRSRGVPGAKRISIDAASSLSLRNAWMPFGGTYR